MKLQNKYMGLASPKGDHSNHKKRPNFLVEVQAKVYGLKQWQGNLDNVDR